MSTQLQKFARRDAGGRTLQRGSHAVHQGAGAAERGKPDCPVSIGDFNTWEISDVDCVPSGRVFTSTTSLCNDVDTDFNNSVKLLR